MSTNSQSVEAGRDIVAVEGDIETGNVNVASRDVENVIDNDDDDDNNNDGIDSEFSLRLLRNKPTLAVSGEPSHNVPQKYNITPSAIGSILVCTWISVGFLTSISLADVVYEESIESMVHYFVDESNSKVFNFCALCFAMFDVIVFCVAANSSAYLAIMCGFLYSWHTGCILFLVVFVFANSVAFLIGETLLKPRMYSYICKHDRYKYFHLLVSDYSVWLGFALFLCPFMPPGLITFLLSLTNISRTRFLIAMSAVIPSTVILCYAGSRISENEFDQFDGFYKSYHDTEWIYVTLLNISIFGAVLFLVCAIYVFLVFTQSPLLSCAFILSKLRNQLQLQVQEQEQEQDQDSMSEVEADADAEAADEDKEHAQSTQDQTTVNEIEGEQTNTVETATATATATATTIAVNDEKKSEHEHEHGHGGNESESWHLFDNTKEDDSSFTNQDKDDDLAWMVFEQEQRTQDTLFSDRRNRKEKNHHIRVEKMK